MDKFKFVHYSTSHINLIIAVTDPSVQEAFSLSWEERALGARRKFAQVLYNTSNIVNQKSNKGGV